MKSKRISKSFGLDIGQTCARVIGLVRKGNSIQVAQSAVMNIADEGILDEAELYGDNGLGKWLREQKLLEDRFCLGLPQYLCTTRIVNDFAAGAKPAQLEQMVHYETLQLAGLSEESFLSDYQCMTPAYDILNPILIGFCREMLAEEQSEKAGRIHLKLQDLGMNGLAMASAFCNLHPEECATDDIHLLMDLGTENSTVVVLCHGNVLYTGSMMFGAKRFTQVLANILNVSEQEAEITKRTYVPDWEDPDSPFLLAARQLETELRTSLDNWRSGELPQLSEKDIAKIWLCGGGSLTKGLAEHLMMTYGCPVMTFGPVLADAEKDADGKPIGDPTCTVAYGLALQGLGEAAYNVSLAPRLLRWQHRKEERFPLLVGATAVFFAVTFLSMAYFDYWLGARQEQIAEGMEELRTCDMLVPKLDAALAQMEYQQKLLVPLVEMGGRSKVFLRSIEEVAKSLNPETKDFCIYVTDEFSHVDYGEKKEQEEEKPAEVSHGIDMFGTREENRSKEPVDVNRHPIGKMPLLGKMIIGGYVGVLSNQKYGAVLQVQNKLNKCGLFEDGRVDWLAEDTEGTGREIQVSQPWDAFLRNNRNLFGEYTSFKLKLPLAKKGVNLPPPPEPKKKAQK